MAYNKFDEMLALVAQAYDSTPEEIRKRITQALAEGQRSTDPHLRTLWASVPHTGDELTLSEFVAYLAATLQQPYGP